MKFQKSSQKSLIRIENIIYHILIKCNGSRSIKIHFNIDSICFWKCDIWIKLLKKFIKLCLINNTIFVLSKLEIVDRTIFFTLSVALNTLIALAIRASLAFKPSNIEGDSS